MNLKANEKSTSPTQLVRKSDTNNVFSPLFIKRCADFSIFITVAKHRLFKYFNGPKNTQHRSKV